MTALAEYHSDCVMYSWPQAVGVHGQACSHVFTFLFLACFFKWCTVFTFYRFPPWPWMDQITVVNNADSIVTCILRIISRRLFMFILQQRSMWKTTGKKRNKREWDDRFLALSHHWGIISEEPKTSPSARKVPTVHSCSAWSIASHVSWTWKKVPWAGEGFPSKKMYL